MLSSRIVMPLLSVPLMFALSTDAEAQPKKRAGANSLGLGVGFAQPSNALNLNFASLRYRLNKQLTLEPNVGWVKMDSTSKNTMTDTADSSYDYDDDDSTDSSSNSNYTQINETTSTSTWMEFGLNLRYRVARKGSADLYVMAGANYGMMSGTDESDDSYGAEDAAADQRDSSSDKYTSDMTAIAAQVGLGIEKWFNPNMSIGVDMFSNVYTTGSSNSDSTGSYTSDGATTDSNSSKGEGTTSMLAVDPNFRIMFHLYF